MNFVTYDVNSITMELGELIKLRNALRATTKRSTKVQLIAEFIKRTPKESLRLGVDFLAGKLPRLVLNVGPSLIRHAFTVPYRPGSPLKIQEVYEKLSEISRIKGAGSTTLRLRKLAELFSHATDAERRFLAELIIGEVRQGAGEGVIKDAISIASGRSKEEVEEALMFEDDIGRVAEIFIYEPSRWREYFGPKLFKPIKPMLAQTAENIDLALMEMSEAALEFKMDGVRVQIHRDGDEVRIFSRHLRDLTEYMPEIVELIKCLDVDEPFIVEGETLVLSTDGKPLPFQYTMSRIGRKENIEAARERFPLTLFLFDVLYLGAPLLHIPYEERWKVLEDITRSRIPLAPRIITKNKNEAEQFLKKAIELGHEGLMAKKLNSPYRAGTRGSYWLKIKPAVTLDLVILAAEWGHGRRKRWLSNYHLGIYDPVRKSFLMVGKTFKGLTDREFEWMTRKLLSLKIAEDRWTVYVKPELVVEVAFNEIQKSPHYDSGYALRFARIKRIRHDKKIEEADTIFKLEKLYEEQFSRKGKP